MNIKLWDKDIPLYESKKTNEHNENCPTMDSYIINDGKVHSCMIICPGGGYDHRAQHEGEPVALRLNEIGINAFVLNYRVAPYTFPVPLADAKRAVRYVRYHADKFNTDPNKIGIMGFSAGGHLACIEAEYYDKFELDAVDEIDKVSARPNLLGLCYPVITAGKEISHHGSVEHLLGNKDEYTEDMSCEENLREDMPPVFMWHAFNDGSVDCRNSLVMFANLKIKGIVSELHIFPDGKHGKGLADDYEGTNQWFSLYANWLKRNDFCI